MSDDARFIRRRDSGSNGFAKRTLLQPTECSRNDRGLGKGVQNFGNAGKTLAEIWSEIESDYHPAVKEEAYIEIRVDEE